MDILQTQLRLLILCLVLTLAACDKTEPLPKEPPPKASVALKELPKQNRQLAELQPSPEALTGKVLQLLADGRQKELKALLVTESEFCKYLWPEFPSNDIPNVTCEWVWGMDEAKSFSSLKGLLDTYTGRKYELVGLDLGQPLEYKTFRIHKNPIVVVRDQTGKTERVALFGPILEIDGGYKLYSYYNRD